eukprot:scaffold64781_cov16-Prasinocladus_malaysianus.AAC.1
MVWPAGGAGSKRLGCHPRRGGQARAGYLFPRRAYSDRGDLPAHPPAGVPPWMIFLGMGDFSFSLCATKH